MEAPWKPNAIAFVGGAAVMAFEMISAKALAPVYGQSLHVWASVIGLTLGALTLGYFLGGLLIDRFPSNATMSLILLGSAALIGVLPLLAGPILALTEPLGLLLGALAAGLLILLLPLASLGMITTGLIRLAAREVTAMGRTAGAVYAWSSIGGIVGALGCGFFAIPAWGIPTTALVTAAALAGAAALTGLPGKTKAVAAGVVWLLIAAPLLDFWLGRPLHADILHCSEGLLGQLVVADSGRNRWLYIDGVDQTLLDKESRRSRFYYIHAMTYFAGHYPAGRKTLVLGLGGGSLANELVRLGFEVDAVELDERVPKLAREFFGLDPKVRVILDDGRHFVRTCRERYSFIALDCFTAEREPTHLLTVESLREMNRILEPDGSLVLDYRTFLDGPTGLGARSILRTLRAAGFQTFCYGTTADVEQRDLIIGAMKDPSVFREGAPARLIVECCGRSAKQMLANRLNPDDSDGYVLTDDASPLDVLNTVYHEWWRRESRRKFAEVMGR